MSVDHIAGARTHRAARGTGTAEPQEGPATRGGGSLAAMARRVRDRTAWQAIRVVLGEGAALVREGLSMLLHWYPPPIPCPSEGMTGRNDRQEGHSIRQRWSGWTARSNANFRGIRRQREGYSTPT